jgi:AcrR family transcriptional regulator
MNLNKDEIVKQEILEAARRVFQKWGLNKTTMEDIAREAGKGKSTLYYYYKSKDEIFETLAISEIKNVIDIARDAISNITSAKQKLKNYITTMLYEFKKTVSIYPIIKGEIKGDKNFIEKIRKVLDDKERSIIMEILIQGIASEEFNFINESQLSKAANVIVGIVRGMMFYLFLDNDDEEIIDIATSLIAKGI